jgi:carboxymethylenebutenolidase
VRPELDAAVIFYGAAPDTVAAAGIRAPVLGLFGGSDARVTETIRPLIEWRERRKELDVDSVPRVFEHEVYPGAGHGFLRHQSGRDGANLAAARDGWRAAVAFLREWLDP